MAETAVLDLTALLGRWQAGDAEAKLSVFPSVYSELHRLARTLIRQERSDHTLQATALVHELYLQLEGLSQLRCNDAGHFLRLAALLMRRILVDYARAHRAIKRGGELRKVPLENALGVPAMMPDLELEALGLALEKLQLLNEQQSQIVELRIFVGLTIEETAQALGISVATVNRKWKSAVAFLHREIREERAHGCP